MGEKTKFNKEEAACLEQAFLANFERDREPNKKELGSKKPKTNGDKEPRKADPAVSAKHKSAGAVENLGVGALGDSKMSDEPAIVKEAEMSVLHVVEKDPSKTTPRSKVR